MLGPDNARALIDYGSKNISNWKLLIQSAGIPTEQRYSTNPDNQIFSLDYYIDNLEIDSQLTNGGTGFCHNALALSFIVTEPNGITLVENLYRAVSQLYKDIGDTEQPNYLTANYCMVIRFYGYDEEGKQVVPVRGGLNGTINTTDSKAIVEKFFPFVITGLTFKQAKRSVEYQIVGACVAQQIGFGTARGAIPFGLNLSGETVGAILQGATPTYQRPATDGRESATTTQANTTAQPFASSGIPFVDPANPVSIAPTSAPLTITGPTVRGI